MQYNLKKKMDALEVNKEIMGFIDYMEDVDEPEIASEYIISQLSYLVSTLTKAEQKEFMSGMLNTMNEVWKK
jgi:hypothetical protein